MANFPVEFAQIADFLESRRPTILSDWRRLIRRDSALVSGDALPTVQLDDHIPALLSAFEACLRDTAIDVKRSSGADEGEEAAAAHGLHRWQQGYDLSEVIRELGLLNEVMVREFDAYAQQVSDFAAAALSEARQMWARSYTGHIEESSARYFELQKLEAVGHVSDLEYALQELNEIDRERADRWREIAHDLRGNVSVVASAADGLRRKTDRAESGENFLKMLERNIGSLRHLLDDVTELTRLRAGHEPRQITTFDVASLIGNLCEGLQSYAISRNLYLRSEGPSELEVSGDPTKITRIAQNLILNALRYTDVGGVTVCWDGLPDDPNRWSVSVRDTGPGFRAGPSAPITAALEEATELSESVDTAISQSDAPVLPSLIHGRKKKASFRHQRAGEGIGLSIVKRLAELLNATVEVESAKNVGTTFRVIFPSAYANLR